MAVFQQAPDSKFVYVIVAARRARQLQSGAPPLLNLPKSRKHTRIAQEELQKGYLEYEVPDRPEAVQEREGKRRRG